MSKRLQQRCEVNIELFVASFGTCFRCLRVEAECRSCEWPRGDEFGEANGYGEWKDAGWIVEVMAIWTWMLQCCLK